MIISHERKTSDAVTDAIAEFKDNHQGQFPTAIYMSGKMAHDLQEREVSFWILVSMFYDIFDSADGELKLE